MKHTLLILIIFTALIGCGEDKEGKPWLVSDRCIKGVIYYSSGYQLAPAMKLDGTLYGCTN